MLPFHAYFLTWLLLPVKCYSNFVSLLKNACFFTPMYDTCCWHSFSIYIEILNYYFCTLKLHFAGAITFLQILTTVKMRSELEKA